MNIYLLPTQDALPKESAGVFMILYVYFIFVITRTRSLNFLCHEALPLGPLELTSFGHPSFT